MLPFGWWHLNSPNYKRSFIYNNTNNMIQQLFRSQQHSERQGIYGKLIPTYMLWKIKRTSAQWELSLGWLSITSSWRWRELNPCPYKEPICFLHAYLGLRFRAIARPKPPTIALSAKISFLHHGLQKPALIFPHRLILSASGRWLGAMSRFSTLCRN